MKERLVKKVLLLIFLIPILVLLLRFFLGDLGANPIEVATRELGSWALRFIFLTLAISPLKILTGWIFVIKYRRMIGLTAFFYSSLHLMSYIGLDQFFYFSEVWQDILKRKYITFGAAGFLMLLRLALTSSNNMIRRFGAKNWKRIHKLIYPASIMILLHFFMMTKADFLEPLLYFCLLLMLFTLRIPFKYFGKLFSMIKKL